MMRRFLLLTLLLPLFCAGFGEGARAQGGVPPSCTVGVIGSDVIYFGDNINILSGQSVDAEGSVSISCLNLQDRQNIRVCLGSRTESSRTLSNLTDNSSSLRYQIFTNSGRDTLFSPVTESTLFVDLSKTVSLAKFTLYGRINPNQQSASVGDYSDTLMDLTMRFIVFDPLTPPSGVRICYRRHFLYCGSGRKNHPQLQIQHRTEAYGFQRPKRRHNRDHD